METDDSPNGYKLLTAGGRRFQYSVHELKKSPFRPAVVCLGLLCVLLLAGIIGQGVHHRNVKRDQQNSYNAMTKEKDNIQENLKTTLKDKRELQGIQTRLQSNTDYLTRQRDQLRTNNNILTKERNDLKISESQLRTSNNALTKERDQLKNSQGQLQTNNDALTKAKDLLQTSYNSALKRTNELQTNYNSVTKDKDNLQNRYNNLTRSREQLQISYNSMIKEVEQLQISHNSSTSEKDKLQSSHSNLTKERDNLQASYNLLKKGTDQLQASYAALIQQRDQLQITHHNATAERDELKTRCDNLTAERDQLQKEVERLNATVIRDKTCLPGWKKFQNSCYFTSTVRKSWTRSRQDCQSNGADLAIINSPEEMLFINGLYQDGEEIWIGLSDVGVEGDWKWVDGTSLTTAYWGDDQPNSWNGNQDCVEFWRRQTGKGVWNDDSCDKDQKWICKM
ncbi:C-type lectin domain family 4 member M-like [Centroberyx affinis]|uniref:C-type lectin domain family 4 member M-like n=1 Tax=Centroberyx affinis TaxID=166261 RepID=UPI003A5C4EAB